MNSIEKVLKIMMAFGPDNMERGTMELSQELGLHKSSVSRILHALVDNGILYKNLKTKKFELGSWLFSMGLLATRSINENLINIAKSFVNELSHITHKTAILTVLYRDEVVIGYVAARIGGIGIDVRPGVTPPFYASASGKAIFSHLPDEVIQKKIREGLPRLTQNTVTDPEILMKRYAKIREQGFSIDKEEVFMGTHSISAPIFNFENKIIAAVAILGFSADKKLGEDSPFIPQLKATAQKITNKLHLVEEA